MRLRFAGADRDDKCGARARGRFTAGSSRRSAVGLGELWGRAHAAATAVLRVAGGGAGAAMTVVAYFVHGRGRGHAARALTITAELGRRGVRVVLFTGGDALDLLAGEPSRELVRVEPVLPGVSALRSFPRRLRGDLGRLSALSPARGSVASACSPGSPRASWSARS